MGVERAARPLLLISVGGGGVVALFAVTVACAVVALAGASAGCDPAAGDAGAGEGPAPTAYALRAIPADRLRLYRAAGARFKIDWTFLASIGAQECNHGSCRGDNGSGCGGPMQIAFVRGSACSPALDQPTEWERFHVDGDNDGDMDVNDPADAIFTAARLLREDKHAPATGGSYAAYRKAACGYYGACSSANVNYADEVMARAVKYGFQGSDTPAGSGDSVPVPPAGACDAGAFGGNGPLADRIVRIAYEQYRLGVHEVPPGSNNNPYGPTEQWCGLFAAWVWQRAGVALPGTPADYGYSGQIYVYVERHTHHVLNSGQRPAPGDAIVYGTGPPIGPNGSKGSAHIGIVVEVRPDGRIKTIEGNSSDRVSLHGPFDPRHVAGAPVWGYAEPPTS